MRRIGSIGRRTGHQAGEDEEETMVVVKMGKGETVLGSWSLLGGLSGGLKEPLGRSPAILAVF